MDRQGFSTRHINYLEKDFLDDIGENINISSLNIKGLGEVRLLKIKEISDFWELEKGKIKSLRLFMEDIISGLYEGSIPLIFAVFGRAEEVEIILGTYSANSYEAEEKLKIIQNSLRSTFQGIDFMKLEPGYMKEKIDKFSLAGLLTGTPTKKGEEKTETIEIEQIERVLRGFFGRECGYLLIADPSENSNINSLFNSVLNETRIVISSEKSFGMESPISKRYKELLQVYLNKLQLAKAQGLWHTSIFLFANNQESLNHVKALVKSAFGGRESLPDRIRTFNIDRKIDKPGLIMNPSPPSPGQFKYPYSYTNTTNSSELAVFAHIPSQEMPGFQIKPYARFKVSIDGIEEESKPIKIGEVLDQGVKIGIPYRISGNDLKKHGLIVGTTGSGKTNTIFYLLKEAWRNKIPFLVIEPAKIEYRKLLLSEEMGDALQVFTLGNNRISPFRINPFEIIPGVSVQTHIDLLKSVFNASFFMWGPLPHVLEECIHEIYVEKGWDLNLNKSLRGFHKNANPTLTDLYNKVDEVVDRLGYSKDTTMEVKSALKTRINSLRIAGKGLMIDTRKSIPIKTLMNKPTILELEYIGDDDEKSFMMGIILTMMYEYYVSQGISEEKGLEHITVIEEAHRLLANYASENPFIASAKGKAVETFTNILSEIRAYGEGFIIAEQIPTKLTSDVVKNTNLKVMHRIVAEDDRRVMGGAMNIEEKMTRKITSLNVGEAAVYSEGDEGAYHIKVPYSKIEGAGKGDEIVIKKMENFRKDEKYLAPFEGCLKFCNAICKYKSIGDSVSSKHRFYSQIPSLVLSLIEKGELTDSILLQMLEMGRDEAEKVQDQKGVKICSIIQASERYFEKIGSQYNWIYQETEKLKESFQEFYMDALEKFMESPKRFSSKALDQPKIATFQSYYKNLCKDAQPTDFCIGICPSKLCLYRFNLSEALNNKYYHAGFVGIINKGDEDKWENLNFLCKEAAQQIVLPGGNEEATSRIALCFALQKSVSIKNFGRRHIEKVMRNLIEVNKDTESLDEIMNDDILE